MTGVSWLRGTVLARASDHAGLLVGMVVATSIGTTKGDRMSTVTLSETAKEIGRVLYCKFERLWIAAVNDGSWHRLGYGRSESEAWQRIEFYIRYGY